MVRLGSGVTTSHAQGRLSGLSRGACTMVRVAGCRRTVLVCSAAAGLRAAGPFAERLLGSRGRTVPSPRRPLRRGVSRLWPPSARPLRQRRIVRTRLRSCLVQLCPCVLLLSCWGRCCRGCC